MIHEQSKFRPVGGDELRTVKGAAPQSMECSGDPPPGLVRGSSYRLSALLLLATNVGPPQVNAFPW